MDLPTEGRVLAPRLDEAGGEPSGLLERCNRGLLCRRALERRPRPGGRKHDPPTDELSQSPTSSPARPRTHTRARWGRTYPREFVEDGESGELVCGELELAAGLGHLAAEGLSIRVKACLLGLELPAPAGEVAVQGRDARERIHAEQGRRNVRVKQLPATLFARPMSERRSKGAEVVLELIWDFCEHEAHGGTVSRSQANKLFKDMNVCLGCLKTFEAFPDLRRHLRTSHHSLHAPVMTRIAKLLRDGDKAGAQAILKEQKGRRSAAAWGTLHLLDHCPERPDLVADILFGCMRVL